MCYPARMDWQPIETAPRNGEVVLVYAPNWRGGLIYAASEQYGYWTSNACVDDHFWEEPTHWMPLPDPPSA